MQAKALLTQHENPISNWQGAAAGVMESANLFNKPGSRAPEVREKDVQVSTGGKTHSWNYHDICHQLRASNIEHSASVQQFLTLLR